MILLEIYKLLSKMVSTQNEILIELKSYRSMDDTGKLGGNSKKCEEVNKPNDECEGLNAKETELKNSEKIGALLKIEQEKSKSLEVDLMAEQGKNKVLEEKLAAEREKSKGLKADLMAEQEKRKDLEGNLIAERKKNEQIKTQIVEKERALRDAKERFTKAQTEIRSLQLDIKTLKGKYESAIHLLDAYKKLPRAIHEGLGNVICEKDALHFIVSCSRDDSLKRIWDYIKTGLGNGDIANESLDVLTQIFMYSFSLYNNSLPKPMYRMSDTRVGDDYDDERHAKGPGSRSSGRINKILLQGYDVVNTGKPYCKSVVVV